MLQCTRVVEDRESARERSEFVENHKEKRPKASSFMGCKEERGEREGGSRGHLAHLQWQEWDWVQLLGRFGDILPVKYVSAIKDYDEREIHTSRLTHIPPPEGLFRRSVWQPNAFVVTYPMCGQ